MRNDILERKQEILEWISDNQPKAFICRELNCKSETLNSYLKKMGIEYSGNIGRKGLAKDNGKYMTLVDYLTNRQYLKISKHFFAKVFMLIFFV